MRLILFLCMYTVFFPSNIIVYLQHKASIRFTDFLSGEIWTFWQTPNQKHCLVNSGIMKKANWKKKLNHIPFKLSMHKIFIHFTRHALPQSSDICMRSAQRLPGWAASISLKSSMRVQLLCVCCMLVNVSNARNLPKIHINYPWNYWISEIRPIVHDAMH